MTSAAALGCAARRRDRYLFAAQPVYDWRERVDVEGSDGDVRDPVSVTSLEQIPTDLPPRADEGGGMFDDPPRGQPGVPAALLEGAATVVGDDRPVPADVD